MKLSEILKKVADGDELSEAEKKYLSEYKEPEQDENRIPKSRLDAEIAKRKKAEKDVEDLNSKLDELNTKFEELESKDLSEADKARKESEKELTKLKKLAETLEKEKEEAAKKLHEIEFKSSVGKIAGKHNFMDSDYLGYLVKTKELDLENEDAVTGYMKELEKNSPNLFKSSAKPGGGTSSATGGSGADKSEYEKAKGDGDVAKMLANAPELKE